MLISCQKNSLYATLSHRALLASVAAAHRAAFRGSRVCDAHWSLDFFHAHRFGASVARTDAGQRPGPYQPGATPGQRPRSRAPTNNPKHQGRGPNSEIVEPRMCFSHRAGKPFRLSFQEAYRLLPPRHETEFHEHYAWDSYGTRFQRFGPRPSDCPARWAGTCLARRPRIRQERGIYPAGTTARQIRAWKFQDPVANQSSCGLKSALRSLAQRIR